MTTRKKPNRSKESMQRHAVAVREYNKEKMVQLNMRLHKETDADVIARLDEVGNKRSYILKLIREDIAKQS